MRLGALHLRRCLAGISLVLLIAGCANSTPPPTTQPVEESRDLALPPGAMLYSATNYNNDVQFEIDNTSNAYVNGAIIIGGSRCPFAATQNGQLIQGSVAYGGNDCPFTARVQGQELYLNFVGMNWVLTQISSGQTGGSSPFAP